MLPVLSAFATQFPAPRRRQAVRHLFTVKGCMGNHASIFDDPLLGFCDSFGHVQFRIDDDTSAVRCIAAIADCFLSLVDEEGFESGLIWDPFPRVDDPIDFRSGGIHSAEAREAWQQLHRDSGVSSWVLTWVNNRVWFRTAQGFDAAALSAENAAKLREPEVEDFVSRKVSEMLRVGVAIAGPRVMKSDRRTEPPS